MPGSVFWGTSVVSSWVSSFEAYASEGGGISDLDSSTDSMSESGSFVDFLPLPLPLGAVAALGGAAVFLFFTAGFLDAGSSRSAKVEFV